MSADAEVLRREIVRKCLREQFDVPLASAAEMSEEQAVDAALDLIASGWLRIEQVRKPRPHRPAVYRLVPASPGDGGQS